MSWNKEWITYRGSVEMIADDQTVHRGVARDAQYDWDLPVMVIECDDGQERWIHPRHVRPLSAWEYSQAASPL